MHRVLLPALAGVALAISACTVGSPATTAGFTDSGLGTNRGGLGGASSAGKSSTAQGTKVASAVDQAPSGQYGKAPKGALADRDYGGTKLDTDHARDLINAYRAKNKLKPLKLNVQLTEAAREHSKDLAKWDRISHFGSDGSNPWDRVKRAGYSVKVAAENVGTGQASFEEVLKGWEDSPAHNKNLLLPDVEHIGLALVSDPKTEFKTFWTLVLAAPN